MWVNTETHVYHKEGTRFYGKTKKGKYVTEQEAIKEGDKAVLSFYETPDGRKIASWVRVGETLKPQFDDITVRVNSEVVALALGSRHLCS